MLYFADQFIVFIHAYWKPNHEGFILNIYLELC